MCGLLDRVRGLIKHVMAESNSSSRIIKLIIKERKIRNEKRDAMDNMKDDSDDGYLCNDHSQLSIIDKILALGK